MFTKLKTYIQLLYKVQPTNLLDLSTVPHLRAILNAWLLKHNVRGILVGMILGIAFYAPFPLDIWLHMIDNLPLIGKGYKVSSNEILSLHLFRYV